MEELVLGDDVPGRRSILGQLISREEERPREQQDDVLQKDARMAYLVVCLQDILARRDTHLDLCVSQ